MINEGTAAGRSDKSASGWFYGVNSVRNPWALRIDQYKWGVNGINRGGLVQTRPGHRLKLVLPQGNLQGGTYFYPNKTGTTGQEFVIFAVDGDVYKAPFPLQQPLTWREFKLPNIKFDPSARQIVFCTAEKSASISESGDITLIPTYKVLMMQDGVTKAAFYDGVESRHLDGSSISNPETPIGLWMAYSGDRLWVAKDNILIGGDLVDPLSFKERTAGDSRGDFKFTQRITGLQNYTGQDNTTQLIVFCEDYTSTLKTGVINRSTWDATANFQSILYPSVGCDAGKSIIFQAGMLWWHAPGGLVNSNAATSAYLSSEVTFKDTEMARTKRLMAGDTTQICGAAFENFILMSVPYAQRLNSHTMVMDYASASEWSQDKIPSWCGVWTGTRPVEWVVAKAEGEKRIFHFSVDYTTVGDPSFNHLWESFQPDREDIYFRFNPDNTITEYRNRIYAQMETGLLGDELSLKKFKYGEVDVCQVGGEVDVKISYRGNRGGYKPIFQERIRAVTEDYQYFGTEDQTKIESYGRLQYQGRRLRTEEVQDVVNPENCESTLAENIDKSFSLLIEWCGMLAVDSIHLFMDAYPEKDTGAPSANQEEACVVAEDGANHRFNLPVLGLTDPNLATTVKSWVREKSYTVQLLCDSESITPGISVTATVKYRSFVSATDAEENALSVAQQRATSRATLYRQDNPCLWRSTRYASKVCESELDDTAREAFQLSSGKIVIRGEFEYDNTTLQKFITGRLSDGSRDLAYVRGGGINPSSPSGDLRDLAVDASGRAYLLGLYDFYGTQAVARVFRLLENGDYDPAFIVPTAITSPNVPACCTVGPDNRLYVGTILPSSENFTPRVTKLQEDGSVDSTFNGALAIITARSLKVQPDGKVLVLGDYDHAGDIYVNRLNTDGSLDGTFTPFRVLPGITYVNALVLLSDGSILIVGTSNITKLLPDGTEDPDFVEPNLTGGICYAAVELPESKIMIAGAFTAFGGQARTRVAVMAFDGTRDAWALTPGINNTIYGLTTLQDGRVLAVGDFTIAQFSSASKVAMINYNEQKIDPIYSYVIRSATITSTVSQNAADTAAQSSANADAEASLPCT